MFLALQEMKKEKLRFAMIFLVMTLIAYLVCFLSALAYGLAELNRTAIDHWTADGIILTESSNGNAYGSSIDQSVFEDLGIPTKQGVNIGSIVAYYEEDTKEEDPLKIVLMGFDPALEDNVPQIIEGEPLDDWNDILLSGDIRNQYPISIGDKIRVAEGDRTFRVCGFTEDSDYNVAPVGYVYRAQASREMLQFKPAAQAPHISGPTPRTPIRFSAIFYNGEPPAEQLLKDHKLKAYSMSEFINELPGYRPQILTFGLMIISLSLIASIIVGIFMYILTMQKRPIFGVLKIQGYRNGYIMGSVIFQTLLIAIGGEALGFGLTALTMKFLPPQVPVKLYIPLILGVGAVTLACSLIGALFSARSIVKIDPLEAL